LGELLDELDAVLMAKRLGNFSQGGSDHSCGPAA
jgi:hypothetical protein